MVWENKVKLIVMLCPEFEREKEEPMNYCLGQKFKDADVVGHEHFVGPENNKEFIKIKLLSREQIGETLILRRLELTMNSNLEINRQNSGPFEQ
jgi:protein tyrosine phosphatase